MKLLHYVYPGCEIELPFEVRDIVWHPIKLIGAEVPDMNQQWV